jgi:DNA-directed RNA polymerase omega subunit
VIQNLPEGVDSKFRMVILLARRAEQLMRGARPKLDAETPLKPTRLAAGEFERNMIRWDFGPEGGSLSTEGEEPMESPEGEES